MQPSSVHYLPLAPLFFLGIALLLAAVVAVIEIGIISYSYQKMGVERRYVYGVLLLSLAGSFVNIPVAEFRGQDVTTEQEFTYFGVRYVVPVVERGPHTILAVNVGGAVIPTILSIYLMVKNGLYLRSLVAVAVMTVIVHYLATPVPGMGIAVPMFIPPVVAAIVAVILSRESAAPLAYIAGSMGTLIGADILNLHSLTKLGASVASIGGAGTFDGIFVSGVLAVMLAWKPRPHPPTPEESIGA
jgi:uncharacterized membrane protein